jgi:predicted aspartyl protease
MVQRTKLGDLLALPTGPFHTEISLFKTAVVTARIDGQEVRLLADAGTSRLLVCRKRLNPKLKPDRTESDPSISTAAGAMHAGWLRASEVMLGKENLGPVTMVVADVDPDPRYDFDGLLGFTKLSFRKVWVDFDHNLLGWD